jgi:hypothetical protein
MNETYICMYVCNLFIRAWGCILVVDPSMHEALSSISKTSGLKKESSTFKNDDKWQLTLGFPGRK